MFFTGEYNPINECKNNIAAKFDMKDLGMMHYSPGLEIQKYLDVVFLNQGKYTVEMLKRFGIMDCKAMTIRI